MHDLLEGRARSLMVRVHDLIDASQPLDATTPPLDVGRIRELHPERGRQHRGGNTPHEVRVRREQDRKALVRLVLVDELDRGDGRVLVERAVDLHRHAERRVDIHEDLRVHLVV